MTLIEFGKLVQKKRKEIGLSQYKLGLQVFKKEGLSPMAGQKIISNIETGFHSNPKAIRQVSNRLGIKPVPEVDTTEKAMRIKDWLNPEISEEDTLLVADNQSLRDYLNTKITVFIKEDCAKFRSMFENLTTPKV